MGCRLMKKQHTESTLQIPVAVSIILPTSKSTSQGQSSGLGLSSNHQETRLNLQSNEIPKGFQEAIQSHGIHICLANKRLLQMEDEIQNQRPIQNFQSPPITGHMSFIDFEQNHPDKFPRNQLEDFLNLELNKQSYIQKSLSVID
ncbi:hypothetical protein pb186bvf_016070 [Paramecium bursaria]